MAHDLSLVAVVPFRDIAIGKSDDRVPGSVADSVLPQVSGSVHLHSTGLVHNDRGKEAVNVHWGRWHDVVLLFLADDQDSCIEDRDVVVIGWRKPALRGVGGILCSNLAYVQETSEEIQYQSEIFQRWIVILECTYSPGV